MVTRKEDIADENGRKRGRYGVESWGLIGGRIGDGFDLINLHYIYVLVLNKLFS